MENRDLLKAISQIKRPVRYNKYPAKILDAKGCPLLDIVQSGKDIPAFGHALAEMINGHDWRGKPLVAEMHSIRKQAVEKQENNKDRGLSEAYIEATTCIEVIDHLLKFFEEAPDRQVKSAEEISTKECGVCWGGGKVELNEIDGDVACTYCSGTGRVPLRSTGTGK